VRSFRLARHDSIRTAIKMEKQKSSFLNHYKVFYLILHPKECMNLYSAIGVDSKTFLNFGKNIVDIEVTKPIFLTSSQRG
jgi:hypothetical protein